MRIAIVNCACKRLREISFFIHLVARWLKRILSRKQIAHQSLKILCKFINKWENYRNINFETAHIVQNDIFSVLIIFFLISAFISYVYLYLLFIKFKNCLTILNNGITFHRTSPVKVSKKYYKIWYKIVVWEWNLQNL